MTDLEQFVAMLERKGVSFVRRPKAEHESDPVPDGAECVVMDEPAGGNCYGVIYVWFDRDGGLLSFSMWE